MKSCRAWSADWLSGELAVDHEDFALAVQTDAIGACLLELEVEAKQQYEMGFKHEATAIRKAAERVKTKVMP